MKFSPLTRQRLYDTALALAALSVVLGVATDTVAAATVAVLAPWLAMARNNVDTGQNV